MLCNRRSANRQQGANNPQFPRWVHVSSAAPPQNCMRYLLLAESVDDLLSRPSEPPRRAAPPPNSRTLDGGGSELAELSLSVEAESRAPARPRCAGLRSDALEPLSDSRPYSPSFLGGTSARAGDARRLLAVELRESPPSDFLRGGGVSPSPRRL